MITITAKTAAGEVLAQASHASEALLRIDRTYEDGDCIEIVSDEKHLIVQMDATILPGEVYLPGGRMTWRVPAGEHRLAYCPVAFTGPRHIVTARQMTEAEVSARRNIACNPSDLRGETDFYPHCTANVETRNEACFCARNVIDGMRHSDYHGEWPFQSWGIGAREDAWCLLDFGREVEVDEMALTLRADFPHDAYWVAGHVALSDGAEIAFDLEKTGDRQYIPLGRHTVRWMRLERMQKSDDPSAFPALIEWEVFGQDR
ncbi:MAG: carbohydrate-binding protein [Clostridiales bacterium]|nr:carbohydrate-binding protein [Clostridiales bacterium]